ncbi:MAG: hypothetical protein ACLVH8_10765 [Fusobacterium sp.]
MAKELKKDNLIIEENIGLVRKGVKLEAGTYKRGSAIGLVGGKYKLIGEDSYTVDTIDGILAEDIIVTENEKATLYQTGQFNSKEIVVKEGTNVSDLVGPARKLGIFIF